MKFDKISNVLTYIFLFIACLWPPFQIYILKVDGAGRSLSFLAIAFLVANLGHKAFIKSITKTPIKIWIVWLFYALFSTMAHGYNDYNTSFSLLFKELGIPLAVMIAINYMNIVDSSRTLNVLIVSLSLNIILTLLFIDNLQSFSMHAPGDQFKINANEFGVAALTLLIIIYLKYCFEQISGYRALLLMILPILCIIVSGSRNAFIGAAIFFAINFLLAPVKHKKNYLHRSVLVLSILIFAFYFVLFNTYVGERLLKTEEQSQSFNLNTNTPLDKIGDRGVFYVIGYEAFKDSPVFGIGLYNTPKYIDFLVQHSEYMIQLSELGIVGSLLFIMFYFRIARKLFVKIPTHDPRIVRLKIIHVSIFIVILVMAFFTRVFNSIYFFSLIGILLSYRNKIKPVLLISKDNSL